MGEPRPILGIPGIATYFPVDSRSPADEVAAGRLTAEQAQYHPDVRAFRAACRYPPGRGRGGTGQCAQPGIPPEGSLGTH